MSERQEIDIEVKKAEYAATSATGNAAINIYNYYYYSREDVKVPPVYSAEISSDEMLPCPYRGLFHFGPGDAEFFFGREVIVNELLQRVQAQNFITLLGASGSGKSSVVFAGLVPKMQQSGNWQFTHFRPGADPFFTLSQALIPLSMPELKGTDRIAETRKMANKIQDDKTFLSDVFTTIQQTHPDERILLIGDQFEELYTLCPDNTIRDKFLSILFKSIQYPSDIVIVITMRADFLGNALSYRSFADALHNSDIKLGSMNREEFFQVIENPAKKLGVSFESGLVDRILDDVAESPGNLALLEFALTELWKRCEGKLLTHAGYDEAGQVKGALANYANEKFGSLAEEEKKQAQRIFIQLVHPGEGTEDTRRLATRIEVGKENWDLVTKLASFRLMVTAIDESHNEETVEIIHEALIREWGVLRKWMEDNREFRTWQERLRTRMHEWEDAKKDDGNLLRSVSLAEAEEWRKKRLIDLGTEEQNFIQLSSSLRDKEQAERKRAELQKSRLIKLLSVVLIVMFVVAGYAFWQKQDAEKQRRIAEEQKQVAEKQRQIAIAGELAAQAESIKEKSSNLLQRSVLLAVSAMQSSPSIQAEKTLRFGISLLPRPVISVKHNSFVNAVDFSPDGKYLATASDDHTARITDVASGQEVFNLQHDNQVWSVDFGQNGKYLLTTSWNSKGGNKGAILVWDMNSGQRLNSIEYGKGAYNIVTAFSPNKRFMVTALDMVSDSRDSRDGSGNLFQFALGGQRNLIRFIDTSTGHEVPDVLSTTNDVGAIEFSPNGKYLSFAVYSNIIILNLSNFNEIANLNYGDSKVFAIAFSPNGKYLVTAIGIKGEIKILETSTFSEVINLKHDAKVNIASFSPDGKFIVTADKKGTVKIWDGLNYSEVMTLKHEDYVNTAVFNSDGKYLSTASDDHTARVWDVRSKSEFARVVHEDAIWDSPDGKHIATASDDFTARIWKLNSKQVREFISLSKVNAVDLSPDGKYIAAIGDDDVYILSVKDDREVVRIALKTEKIDNKSASLSLDGKYLAAVVDIEADVADGTDMKPSSGLVSSFMTGSVSWSKRVAETEIDGAVRVWEITSGKEVIYIEQDNAISVIALSPDGKYIATGCDQTGGTFGKLIGTQIERDIVVVNPYARVFEVSTGREIAKKKYDNGVESVAFSHDEQHLAIATPEGMVEIWKGARFDKQISSIPHEKGVHSMAFSPDGKYIAMASGDNVIRMWEIEGRKEVAHIPHLEEVETLSFTSDGRYILTLGKNHSLQKWPWKPQDLIDEACAHLTRNLTYDEWKTYMPEDEPYTATCKNLPIHPSVASNVK